MAAVGVVLEAAWRIVDDLEILVILCHVYLGSQPRPSRRRLLKALLRTMRSEDRERPLRSDGEASSSLSPPPPMLQHDDDGEDNDEAIFAATSPHRDDRPSAWPPEVGDDWDWGRRILDELALFGSWRCVVRSLGGRGKAGIVQACCWLAARLVTAGAADSLWQLPWPALAAYRAVLAHPFERWALGAEKTSGWAGWRGAVATALLDVSTWSLGLAYTPRIKALLGLDVAAADVARHATASIRALPLAVASVAAARVLGLALFGAARLDRLHRSLSRRLTRSRLSRTPRFL